MSEPLTENERKTLALAMYPDDGNSMTLAQVASITVAVEAIVAARVAEAGAADRATLARIRALCDEWGDEDELIEHVGACGDFGCKTCVVAACAYDLRAALQEQP
jgi:hypothetical protein